MPWDSLQRRFVLPFEVDSRKLFARLANLKEADSFPKAQLKRILEETLQRAKEYFLPAKIPAGQSAYPTAGKDIPKTYGNFKIPAVALCFGR